MSQGARVSVVGTLTGVAAALGMTRGMRSVLYGVGATDPPTFALVPLGLFLVALLATYVPARRATRIDPATALREE